MNAELTLSNQPHAIAAATSAVARWEQVLGPVTNAVCPTTRGWSCRVHMIIWCVLSVNRLVRDRSSGDGGSTACYGICVDGLGGNKILSHLTLLVSWIIVAHFLSWKCCWESELTAAVQVNVVERVKMIFQTDQNYL